VSADLFNRNAPQNMQVAVAQIPVIDFGPYFAGDPDALGVLGRQVAEACQNVGFFYLQGHGVDASLITRAFAASRRFYALPLAEKLKLKVDQYNVGYLPMNASIQRHSTVHQATKPNENESFFIIHDRDSDHPDVLSGKPLRGVNYWPDGLLGFREDAMAYFNSLNQLGQKMLPAFAVALGMEQDFFAPLFTDTNHATLRMLHYPPTRGGDNAFGQGPHTDNGFLTILARSEIPGLAVQLPSGEWVTPPLIEGTFLVNLGNIMRRMSNDRFKSTPHGVVVEGDKDRYSLAYFHSPNPYRVVEVLPSCVDDAHPAIYEPRLYADLIMEFFRANYAHQQGHNDADMPNRYA
jgi:isopenicillin N synthase-like dioxygenase